MAVFPTSLATDADLYIAVNNLSTTQTDNPLTSGATTVNVATTTGFPTVGIITIDLEAIHYTGITATSFTGCTRGFDGTTADTHAFGSIVRHDIPAAHHNAPKDEIIAIESFIDTHIGKSTVVTAVEFERLSGVTSPIQTQLNAKATDTLVVHLAGTETITGAKTFSETITSTKATGNSLIIDTTTLVVDASNNRVGIGTASPAFDLDVVGTGQFSTKVQVGDGSVGSPSVTFSSDTDLGIYRSGSDTMRFAANSTNIFEVGTSGTFVRSGSFFVGDGSAGSPVITFADDTDTGIFRQGSGIVSISSDNFESQRFGLSSSADATMRVMHAMKYGGNNAYTQFLGQTTTGVSTTPTSIIGVTDALIIVTGNDSGTGGFFRDVIVTSYNAAVTVLNSGTASGAPAARTYTSDATDVKLQMASGTYAVNTFAIDLGRR